MYSTINSSKQRSNAGYYGERCSITRGDMRGLRGNGNNGDNSSYIQRQNSVLEDELFIKVGELKSASKDLSGIIRHDRHSLDRMNDLFGGAGDLMGEAMRKFKVMQRTGGMNTVCYLTLFMLLVCFLFYFLFF